MISFKDVLISMHEKELPLPKTHQSMATLQEGKKCHCFCFSFWGGGAVWKCSQNTNMETLPIAHCINVSDKFQIASWLRRSPAETGHLGAL